jgi:hypothetical protein
LDLHVKNKHSMQYILSMCVPFVNGGSTRVVSSDIMLRHTQTFHLTNARFVRKSSLSLHVSLKRHFETCQEKDKPFVCDICRVSFSRKSKLSDHIKGKHGAPSKSCVCGKYYRKLHILYTHSNLEYVI